MQRKVSNVLVACLCALFALSHAEYTLNDFNSNWPWKRPEAGKYICKNSPHFTPSITYFSASNLIKTCQIRCFSMTYIGYYPVNVGL